MAEEKKYEEMMVVTDSGLLEATQQGWKLIRVLNEVALTDRYEQEVVVIPAYEEYGTLHAPCAQLQTIQKSHPVQECRYLLGKDRDDVVAQLRESIRNGILNYEQLKKDRDGFASDLEKAHETLDSQSAVLQGKTDRELESQRDLRESEKSRRKLESDIANIRKEIGEAKMKDILSDAE